MALPSSGTISLSDVNTNIGASSTATITMNDAPVRWLANGNTSTNPVSMNSLYGKSWVWTDCAKSNTAYLPANSEAFYARYQAVDSSGNVYSTCLASLYNSGTGLYVNTTYLIKANPVGTIQWVKRLDLGSYNLTISGVSTDSSDNVYLNVIGYNSSNTNFYGGVAKLNSSGVVQWSTLLTAAFAVSGQGGGRRCGIDGSGNVYAVAINENNSFLSTMGAYIIKLNSSGTLQYQKQVSQVAVSLDTVYFDMVNSYIYVGGTWYSGASYNGFIGKYDLSLTASWQKEVYVNGLMEGLVVDSSQNVYFSTNTLSRPCLQKLNSSGTFQWSIIQSPPSGGVSYIGQYHGLGIDSSNNIYLQGGINGGQQLLYTKFNTSGTLLAQVNVATSADGGTSQVGSPFLQGSYAYGLMSVTPTTNGGVSSFKIPNTLTTTGTYGTMTFSSYSAGFTSYNSYPTVNRSATINTSSYSTLTGVVSLTDVTSSWTNTLAPI